MAGRRAAQRRLGGGDGIQALRQAGARLTPKASPAVRRAALALGSLAAYGAVAAWTLTRGGPLVGILAVFDGIGAVILGYVLWRGSLEILPWALATGGGAYAGTLYVGGHHTDQAVPLVAAALLVCSELAAWSLDARWHVTAEGAVLRRRALALGALVGAGIVASGAVIAFSGAAVGGGLVLTTLGAAAAVGAVGAGVALLLRGR